jgi:hypothetical protein
MGNAQDILGRQIALPFLLSKGIRETHICWYAELAT